MSEVTVLIVPGLRDHVTEHWQTLLAGRLPRVRMVEAMGREDLLGDARFATFSARVAHADEINAIVGEWVRQRTADQVEAILVDAQVPVTRAHSIADIAADPHYLPAFPLQPSHNLSAVGFRCASPARA